MASKGQKYRKYTNEEKNEILEKYKEGISSSYIAKEYGISASTIREWKYKSNHVELFTGNKRGRPKEKDLKKILVYLTNVVRSLLNADRCSIFLNDKHTNELWTIVAHGVKEIRMPNTKGFAGFVFQTGQSLNIPDVYKDERFNKIY